MTPATASPVSTTLRGGEWLIQSSKPADVFTPERLSEEHRLIAQTVTDFVNNDDEKTSFPPLELYLSIKNGT